MMKNKFYEAWQRGKIRCTINFTDFLEGAMAIKNGRLYSSLNDLIKKHNQIWLDYSQLYRSPTMQQLIEFMNGKNVVDKPFSVIIKGIHFELIN